MQTAKRTQKTTKTARASSIDVEVATSSCIECPRSARGFFYVFCGASAVALAVQHGESTIVQRRYHSRQQTWPSGQQQGGASCTAVDGVPAFVVEVALYSGTEGSA